MARKLNKKVAIIGSLILTMALVGGIFLVLGLNEDPKVLIEDAEVALAQAETLVKDYRSKGDFSEDAKEIVADYYGTVERNYKKAFGAAQNDELRIKVLFTLADFYQIDNEFHPLNWKKIRGCWKQITTIDTKNVDARLKEFDFNVASQESILEVYPGGALWLWTEIKKEAIEIIKVMGEKDTPVYIKKAKAQASLALADSDDDPDKCVADSIKQFEDVLLTAPKDAELYNLLANAYLEQGRIRKVRGISSAMEEATAKQREILLLAVEKADDKDIASLNELTARLSMASEGEEVIESLKGEFAELAVQHSSSAKVHAGFSRFIAVTDSLNFDAAIDEISKAIDVDKGNIQYAMLKASLYYNKAMVQGDTSALDDGIDIAEKALILPDAQDIEGPGQNSALHYRLSIYEYLAKGHIERALIAQKDGDDEQKDASIANAEDAVYQIKQIKKTSEFIKYKWDGLLAMAKGDRVTAISSLYYAQELLKATEDVDSFVSYFLSKLLEGGNEIGSRAGFLTDALLNKYEKSSFISIASTRPEALLDYADLLIQMFNHANAKSVAAVFEERYGSNDRSTSILILCDTLSQSFDDAEAKISKLDTESSQTIGLQMNLINARISNIALNLSAVDPAKGDNAGNIESAKLEIKQLKNQRLLLVKKIIALKPDTVPFPFALCVDFVRDGEIEKAKELTEEFIAASDNDTEALIFKLMLAEPDPLNIPKERQNDIQQEVYNAIDDPFKRHILLAKLYVSQQENEKALAEYQAAVEISNDDFDAVGGVFDTALKLDDIETASGILPLARKNNFDECGGEFFSARIDIAKKLYDDALKGLDECLNKRPIFPYAFLLKSQAYAGKGDHENAVKNAVKAASINSLDGMVAKQVVLAIEARNIALGSRLDDSHRAEMKQALIKAMALNKGEWQIQSMYAKYISETEPENAISVQQNLAKRVPTVDNNLALGQMSMNLAIREITKEKKDFFFDIARAAFEFAYNAEPENDSIVESYCDFLRVTDQDDAALKILDGRGKLLWQYHLRDGQFDKAKLILDELYIEQPKDVEILKGLMLASQQTSDKEGIKTYSQELLAIDKSMDNELLQIQVYLDSGLVSEASDILASFRTRNPDEQRGLLLQAWSTMSDGKIDIALKLIDQYLAVDPANSIAWRLRGQIHSISGDYKKAIQDMLKSKELEDSSAIQIDLANVYNRSGNPAKAIGVLSEALSDGRAPLRMRLMLEDLYIQSGRKTELPKFYKKTLDKYPDSIDWHFRAGRFSLTEGKFADAEKYFFRALELGKDSDKNHAVLDGYLSAIRGDRKYTKAINAASKYTETVYAPVAYLNMANAEEKLDNREKALEYYYKAIEKSGDSSSFIIKILSNMSSVLGIGEVVKWCDAELARDKTSFAANRMMSMVMVEKKQYDQSISYIEKCLEIFEPDTDEHLELLAVKANVILQVFMETSSPAYLDSAIKTYEIIIARRPNNPGIMNNLAYLLAETGRDVDKALKYAERAHKMTPNDANLMDTYAFVLCKSGDYKKAKELIQSAIGILDKDNVEIHWDVMNHFAMANEGLGEIEEAKENYKQALRLAAENISPKDKEELIAAIARVSK